ncbi:Tetranectin [Saguinus oedipus]|uniref:Tetranectin n=1 Tax=Saguinus oedipus TaxID=9490 RepID=A0ABQ9U1S0_SAGOE|nr:Tetranectin [Saguinus oedipus]
MELWGAYLLLCLFSLLTEVTAEPQTQKDKKAANPKKGPSVYARDTAEKHGSYSW